MLQATISAAACDCPHRSRREPPLRNLQCEGRCGEYCFRLRGCPLDITGTKDYARARDRCIAPEGAKVPRDPAVSERCDSSEDCRNVAVERFALWRIQTFFPEDSMARLEDAIRCEVFLDCAG